MRPLLILLRIQRLGKVSERVRWILFWTDLRSLLIFFGFWVLWKVVEW